MDVLSAADREHITLIGNERTVSQADEDPCGLAGIQGVSDGAEETGRFPSGAPVPVFRLAKFSRW